jgi:hypothetical protein
MRPPQFLAALGLVACVTLGAAGQTGWLTTVDLNPGEMITVTRDSAAYAFRILNDANGQPAITYDTMPFPTTSVEHRVNYLRDYPDAGLAIAGGYQFMWAGETRVLDGGRSRAQPERLR